MTDLKTSPEAGPGRRAGELDARELLRWTWRQLTSMRTALILLLVLALAAIPGSVIPQEGVDALGTSRWKDDHPTLTPIYERLDLFSVYDSAWFSAIYILLVLSLVGCIVPRTFHYWRGIRAQPPAAPRNLSRLPDHSSYQTTEPVDEVLAKARAVLKRGHRLRDDAGDGAVSAERGYLREVGNLVFHLSVLVVLVGFAMGGLFGYKGAVIVVQGGGFGNNPNQYDDFNPGRLFSLDDMDNFSFDVEKFDIEWLTDGPRAGMARAFNASLSYQEGVDGEQKRYDLRVNHPLKIGGTELFLVGHGYAPVITVRDGDGDVAYSGPTVFLPQDASFLSFGVVKAPDAQPTGIGLEGLFYPTFYMTHEGDPATLMGDDNNPLLSMLVYAGDLNMDSGPSQSVYVLDKSRADQVTTADGQPFRLDIGPGKTVDLPDGLGSVTFEGIEPWVRLQISKSPGQYIALVGVSLALLGLLGSLFIRPRRVWVRARREGGVTMVDVAALDRSGGGDVTDVLAELVAKLKPVTQPADKEKP
jgi:cytochrome c biogenesis protein